MRYRIENIGIRDTKTGRFTSKKVALEDKNFRELYNDYIEALRRSYEIDYETLEISHKKTGEELSFQEAYRVPEFKVIELLKIHRRKKLRKELENISIIEMYEWLHANLSEEEYYSYIEKIKSQRDSSDKRITLFTIYNQLKNEKP